MAQRSRPLSPRRTELPQMGVARSGALQPATATSGTGGMATIARSSTGSTTPEVHGQWLRVVQVAWLAVAIVGWALFIMSIPPRYAVLGNPPLGMVQALAQLGLSTDFYATYNMALEIILALTFSGVAAVIFWRKSHEWIALQVAFMLLLFGVAARPILVTLDALVAAEPGWTPLVHVLTYLAWFCVFTFFYLFPDGRFIPRWTRLLAVGVALILIPWDLFPDSPLSPWNWPPLPFIALELALWGSGVAVQIYRYKRQSTQTQRQQTRWVVFGVTATVVFGLIFYFPRALNLLPTSIGTDRVFYDLASTTGLVLAALLTPLTIGISILRYRLWGIDMIVNRALVYVPLTAILAGVYSAAIALFQKVFTALTGNKSDAAVVITTLLLVTVFTPVKNALQSFVDKRFKEVPDPDHVLKAFTDEVAADMDVIDPRRAARRLLEEAVHAYQALSGAVYLGPADHLQVVEVVGQWKEQPVVSVPLVSNSVQLGLLALGARPNGREYSTHDRDTLQQVVDLIANSISPETDTPSLG